MSTLRSARLYLPPILIGILAVAAVMSSSALAVSGYGELSRFKGGKGHEFELEGQEAFAFAADPETGTIYVGDEKSEGSEELRVQSFSSSGTLEGEALVKPPATLPTGDEQRVYGYEGIAVDTKLKRIYVLANYSRFSEDSIDGGLEVAGALYAFKSTPNGSKVLEPAEGTSKTKGEEGLVGTLETLRSNSETPAQSILRPSGITVDPETDEVLVFGLLDSGTSKAPAYHPGFERVSSSGVLGETYVDPNSTALNAEPDSPVVSGKGKLFFEAADELFELPANAKSSVAPTVVFHFLEPESLAVGPFEEELVNFGEGGTSSGDGLSIISESGQNRIVAFAETHVVDEATGVAGESVNAALNLKYTEEGETVKVSELGWTGGQPGEGGGKTIKACEIGFAGINPEIAAASGDTIDILAPAWSEVIRLGPGGTGCPGAKAAATGLEASLANKKVTEVEEGNNVTLSANIVEANVVSVKWIYGDGQEATVETPAGEQTQSAEVLHKFVKSGPVKVEAIIQTDNLETPEIKVSTTITVKATTAGAPKVTTPPSNQTVVEGETATFKAAASGEPTPTVQWEVKAKGASSWTTVSGAVSDTLTVPSTTVAESGNEYRATFKNSISEATSNPATLTVETVAQHKAKVEAEEQKRHEEEAAAQKKHEEEAAAEAARQKKAAEEAAATKKAQEEEAAARKKAEEEAAAKGKTPPPPSEGSPRAIVAGSSLSVSSTGAVTLKISCPAGVGACSGTVTLKTLTAVSAKASASAAKKSILTLASGPFTVSGGQTKTVTLHLSSKARALLAHSHLLRVKATVVARNALGASSTVASVVTLRLAAKKK
jgi:Immunoglobulin I-set domain